MSGQSLLDRRRFLRGAGGVCAASVLAAGRVLAQGARPGTIAVNDRITVITGVGGNVVVRGHEGGTVVVDSGAAEHTDALIGAIDAIAGTARVHTLFNTHWHLDQTGGNARLREQGAAIAAHAKTHAHLATPYYLPGEDRYQPAAPPEAHPTETFHDGGVLELGDSSVRYGYLLEAHTDGDIYVLFEDDNVIAAGDAISPVQDPAIDWYGGGWLGGRVDCLELLLDMSDSETRFVPAYGPVVDRGYVQAEHDLMLGLFDILWERIRAGESADDIVASGALDTLPRRFDDPGKLVYDSHKSLWAHYNTLSPDIV